MRISESELILNPDGSLYHIKLLPGDVADTIITVGDPNRVDQVSRHFDTIEISKQNREFKTKTGTYNGKRLTVISTGIGSGNIDIVMNELDALVNIDLNNRTIKEKITSLKFIRIGTSGGLQPDVKVDSFVVCETAIGFDNLLHFYDNLDTIMDVSLSEAFSRHLSWKSENSTPIFVHADKELLDIVSSNGMEKGITTTNIGFYGPQGRVLRLPAANADMNDKIASFKYGEKRITNLEMETASIYGLAALLGHKAVSLNAILANRNDGTFSENPKETIDRLIIMTLNNLCK